MLIYLIDFVQNHLLYGVLENTKNKKGSEGFARTDQLDRISYTF
jgi:hypothetical protein